MTCIVGCSKSELVWKLQLIEDVRRAKPWFNVTQQDNLCRLDELVADWSFVSLVVQTQTITVRHSTTLTAVQVDLPQT